MVHICYFRVICHSVYRKISYSTVKWLCYFDYILSPRQLSHFLLWKEFRHLTQLFLDTNSHRHEEFCWENSMGCEYFLCPHLVSANRPWFIGSRDVPSCWKMKPDVHADKEKNISLWFQELFDLNQFQLEKMGSTLCPPEEPSRWLKNKSWRIKLCCCSGFIYTLREKKPRRIKGCWNNSI